MVRSLLVLLLLSTTVSGCSNFGHTATPEAKGAVLQVATEYLRNVVLANDHQLEGLVVWSDYFKDGKKGINQQQYYQALRVLRARWSPEEHPLLGLAVKDLSVSGDNAEITFQKAHQADAPQIWIKLIWAGTGWLITDDSLFGKNGVLQAAMTGSPKA